MATTSGSNLRGEPLHAPRAAAAEAPRDDFDERRAAEWAGLLLGALIPRDDRILTLPAPENRPSPAAPNSPATPGTLGSPSSGTAVFGSSQPADTPGVNTALPTRVVLDVATATLGRLQLVVDRDPNGVRVTIGGNLDARTAISADQSQLAQVLEAAGVQVTSFRVVTPRELGTVLAQGSESQRQRGGEDKRTPFNREAAPKPGPRRRRLDLIG